MGHVHFDFLQMEMDDKQKLVYSKYVWILVLVCIASIGHNSQNGHVRSQH